MCSSDLNNGLNGNAVFTYELYNEMTGTTDTIKGECPFELTGKSLADVKEYYPRSLGRWVT